MRRGCWASVRATSACTSAGSGRVPSTVTVTQVPGTGSLRRETNSPLGSVMPSMPRSCRSKQPTSSIGPNRFLIARTMRSREWRSPSKLSTTSTRCSRVRGPAMEPSLVTWPTRTVAMLRSLAIRTRLAATSRTCVTPPGTPVACAEPIVWTESTTSSRGSTFSTWVTRADSSVSAAR